MSENKQIYIMSLDASDIYNHMHRGTSIKRDYCGMIPNSLELIKLRKEGLKVKKIGSKDKEISNDIINVKFKSKVKSGIELKNILKKKKKGENVSDEYIKRLDEFIGLIDQSESIDQWKEISVNDLRRMMYTEGFKIKYFNKNTNETKDVEYVVYKRSSAKSRTGQCLFIKKSLYNKMIKWSRMNLPMKKNMKIDLAGLLAYESLVGSSIEETICIDSDKILMVEDIESKFFKTCNVVKKGENGFLDSFTEKVLVKNSLFDGESLLDKRFFRDNSAMKLLRNHMFKSASFNCDLQRFFKEHCPKGILFDEWKLTDMFGNTIYAKDVELICTPSSLKAFKFSKIIGNEKDMWEYWKQIVKREGNIFGVCKHEKQSKFGKDEQNNLLQQTSYQMINCLPLNKEDVRELTMTEKQYINRLKNDDNFFISKVRESATLINSHEMMVALYNHNKSVINTKLFRDFRKGFIRNHLNHSKKGKIKLKGDYCVMLGNPMEFLYHAIGQFNVNNENNLTLKVNEVYTTLFDFDRDFIGFRNPNTSPSNVLVVKNKKVEDIQKYFNLTKNIVCVNAVNFPIQDILSGCDYDSDTVLLLDDPKLLSLGKQCFENYNVCINHIEGKKKEYRLNKHDMYEIDAQLSTSQRNIGKVVNLGQFCMSVYWDIINNHKTGMQSYELLKKVDVMTILSGIAIDMAKKFYEIDIEKEIQNVEKNHFLQERKQKPLFWKYVSQSKTIKNRVVKYDCPMDYLIGEIEMIPKAKRKENICFEELLIKKDISKANHKQLEKIINKIEKLNDEIKNKNASISDIDERVMILDEIISECVNYIKKLKINEFTMYLLIKHISEINDKLMLKLFQILYQSHPEKFLNIFKNDEK